MDAFGAIVRELGIPVRELRWFDVCGPPDNDTYQIVPESELVIGRNILAEKIVEPGFTGFLLGWFQYEFWWDEGRFPRNGQLPWHLPNPAPPLDNYYWRVAAAGKPLPDLGYVQEIRNPWFSWAHPVPTCFYAIEGGQARTPITLEWWVTFVHDPPEYEVGGRLVGFTAPTEHLYRKPQRKQSEELLQKHTVRPQALGR